MPTTLHRFQVTETPQVERALRIAEEAWPEASRSERVLRLLTTAADALDGERSARRERRLAAIDFSEGSLEVEYEPGYLEELREDWPE